MDRQQSIDLLKSAEFGCHAALTSLTDPSQNNIDTSSASDHAVLLKDLLSLMSLIHASTTKLSLALKPPSPTYSASLTPLKDISHQITAISHCVRLFQSKHGLTLKQEVISIAKDIIQSVCLLLQIFRDIAKKDRHMDGEQAEDEYLIRIGMVHDIIDKAKAPGGMSRDNLTSVQKKWAQDHGSLDDGLNEVDGMIKDALQSDPEQTQEDDGWDELGMDSTKKMDVEEIERAKKVHTLLRLSTLLHKHVLKDILSPTIQPPSDITIQHLDALPPLSAALLVASDDLIAATYVPQNVPDILAAFLSFIGIIHRIQLAINTIVQESMLVGQMEAMNLQNTTSSRMHPKKWFETCFDQIQKAGHALNFTLDQNAER